MEKEYIFKPDYSNSNPEYEKLDSFYRDFYLSEPVRPVFDKKIRTLCKQPYHKHPKGCPNIGTERVDCPPSSGYFPEIFEVDECLVASVIFDFRSYVQAKKEIHPDWTNRALVNQRHWQGHLKAELNKQIKQLLEKEQFIYKNYMFIPNPEAMGINLQETCKLAGLELLWPEQTEKWEILTLPEYICQVGLLARKKQ